jgi:hypothetical protein
MPILDLLNSQQEQQELPNNLIFALETRCDGKNSSRGRPERFF